MRALTALWGAILEAWQELRIHKTRVLLSLIGVGAAVCALSSVVSLANLAGQSILESNERYGGRPALIAVYQNGGSDSASTASTARVDEAWAAVVERHAIRYTSKVAQGQMTVQFRDGTMPVQTVSVDEDYATMHRTVVRLGRWFDAADAERLAPAIIVNEDFWTRLGTPPLETHPTATVRRGESEVTAVVIGVVRTPESPDYPTATLLGATADRLVDAGDPDFAGPPTYEAWVPPEDGDALASAIQSELDQRLGADAVGVNRQDYQANDPGDPLALFKVVVLGIAVLILLLGALGLVNIAMVTVRGRIREIGIRRSFGATAPRVFFAVMMESVVATVVAGAAGVALSILLVKNPWVEERIASGMVADPPPFPVEAAVIGLVAATGVGALAGLLPALVAVRVKVIDAIRY